MITLLYLLAMIYYYNVAITFLAWKKHLAPWSYDIDCDATFLVLIACHNEEDVIEGNLLAIYNNSYDRGKYKVYVVADNCTDNTVGVCEDFWLAHKDMNLHILPVNGGSKPKALNSAISYLKANGSWDADNIVILDADNKISSSLLESYNYYHGLGDKILQCRILSDNDDSFVAKGFTSSFNTMGCGFQLARNRAGWSASLSGTGFSVDRNVFDEVDFEHCTTLTEDLEFSVLSIIKGYKVRYVPEQYVLNQNLDELKPSIIQRVRWCRGHMQVSVKLTGKVIRAFLKKPSFQLFDTFLFINSPSKSWVYLLGTVAMYILGKTIHEVFIWINIACIAYSFAFIWHCNRYRARYLLPHIAYAFFMYFIILYAAVTYRKTKWVKTVHKKV